MVRRGPQTVANPLGSAQSVGEKMSTLSRRHLLLGAGASSLLAVNPALANCTATSCDVAGWQATRQPYRGPLDGRLALACVRLLASTNYAWMTEVILVGGASAEHGPVLTSLGRGNGHAFQLPNQPAGTEDVYVREFCFNPELIRGWDAVTFCNGFAPGDGNHHTVTDQSLVNLKQTGHVGDFLSLLGTARSYSPPVSTFFNSRRYRDHYGRHGVWLGT